MNYRFNTLERIMQGVIIGIFAVVFAAYGPIVWNVDLPDYTVLRQGLDKMNWYCGNALIYDLRCYTFRIDNVATILIPNSLEFIAEL